jgi:hypothetical protein
MNKFNSTTLLLLLPFIGNTQNKIPNYTKEFSFKTENDAYLFNLNDSYYTNGFILNYAFMKNQKEKKKIQSLELGQKTFTPSIRETKTSADIDRPYCGYLYLNYAQTQFLKKERVLQLNGALGLVGRSSWGEGLQNTYHSWLGFAKFTGWKYQIENALGVDIGATYASGFMGNNEFKILSVFQVNLGTTFTNTKWGAMMVWGAFEKNSQSALWNARLGSSNEKSKRKHEFFGYFYPQIIAQAYNATLQGGIFNNGAREVTQTPSSFMYQQTLGVCYASGRFTGRIEYIYQSKETAAQIKSHRFGSFQIAYRIH